METTPAERAISLPVLFGPLSGEYDWAMTEREVKDRCLKLAAESPERTTHSWLPREGADGGWTIVKLGVPSPASPDLVETTASTEQRIKEDPRNPFEQNVPPNGAVVGF